MHAEIMWNWNNGYYDFTEFLLKMPKIRESKFRSI